MPNAPMTRQQFTDLVGHAPNGGDLEQVNCSQVGQVNHHQCGVCTHGYPKILACPSCTNEQAREPGERWSSWTPPMPRPTWEIVE